MTRGIFDPGGGGTAHSGSTFLGPEAQNGSRVPPDVTDGEVEGGDDAATLEAVDRAEDTPPPMARDDDEAARRLRGMAGSAGDHAGHAGS